MNFSPLHQYPYTERSEDISTLTPIPLCTHVGSDAKVDKQVCPSSFLDKLGQICVALEVVRLASNWFMDVPEDVSLNHVETIVYHCLQWREGGEEEGRGGREERRKGEEGGRERRGEKTR